MNKQFINTILVCFLISVVLVYIAFTFTHWQLNPLYWGDSKRGVACFIVLLSSITLSLIASLKD